MKRFLRAFLRSDENLIPWWAIVLLAGLFGFVLHAFLYGL